MTDTHVSERSIVDELGRGYETGKYSKAVGREGLLPAPDRSIEQRMDALQEANRIRTKRAYLKRDLKSGRTEVIGLILDPPEWMQTMHLFELLVSVPKYGRVKVNRMLTMCRISPSKTVGGLSERQRGEIAFYLRN